MDFSCRKLSKEEGTKLRARPVARVQPYVLLFTPAYVYLKANEKYLSVRSPLDFFAPEELTRLASFEEIYLDPSIDLVDEFGDAARRVRQLLSWQPSNLVSGEESLPLAPYEISDAALRILGSVWGKCIDGSGRTQSAIEPFYVAAFVETLCGSLPPELIMEARERDVMRFEHAILVSAWAAFLGLHLGHIDLDSLSAHRMRVFKEVIGGVARLRARTEIDDIADLARASLSGNESGRLTGALLASRDERVARKLVSRIERLTRDLIPDDRAAPSIRGERGFLLG